MSHPSPRGSRFRLSAVISSGILAAVPAVLIGFQPFPDPRVAAPNEKSRNTDQNQGLAHNNGTRRNLFSSSLVQQAPWLREAPSAIGGDFARPSIPLPGSFCVHGSPRREMSDRDTWHVYEALLYPPRNIRDVSWAMVRA